LASVFDENNRLFVLARQGRRRSSVPAAVAVVFVVMAFGLIPGQIPGRIVLFTRAGVPRFSTELQPLVEQIVMNVAMFGAMFAAMWAWLRFWTERPFATLGWDKPVRWSLFLRGVGAAFVMVTVVCGVSAAWGVTSSPGLLSKIGPAAYALRLASLLAFFVQGPAEETLFRGWLMPVIGVRYRPWIGVIGSSMLFSLAHGLNRGMTMFGFVNLFLFGLCAAVFALRDGSLWRAGAWHGAWNWTMGDLFGFTLDGSPRIGLFTSMDARGPAIISGGAFGPDGGLVCSAVLLTAIVFLSCRPASGRDRSPGTLPGPSHVLHAR
jgi:membrane protease YdiL (CAAX protease family)